MTLIRKIHFSVVFFSTFCGAAETAISWLEPYPHQNAIKDTIDRYHLKAGVCACLDSVNGKTNRLSFLLYSPKTNSQTPLLLFIPGIGEIGSDLSKQFSQRTIFDVVTSERFQRKHPCYFLTISPKEGTGNLCASFKGEPGPEQQEFLDALVTICDSLKSPAVDRSRIYVTGLSFGGTSIYGLAFVSPCLFAAAAPLSATVLDPEDIPIDNPGNYYHIFNEGDYRYHQGMIERLETFKNRVIALGGDFRVGSFPNEGHNAWDAAWKEDAMWDWMFSKKRGVRNASPSTPGRVPDPTRRAGREENHAENAESAENAAPRPPAVTASKPGRDARTGPERALDGLDGTAYISASPVSAGDWLQVEWSAPVLGRIEVRTGLSDGTLRLSKGRVEVSADGRVWSRTGTVSQKTGVCAFGQRTGIRFLRLIPEPRVPEPLAVREIAVKP